MTKTRQETDNNARDTQYSIGHALKRILVRATVASKPVRARLLWATLSLALPVTFGHIAACRSAALALSATIHFVTNRHTNPGKDHTTSQYIRHFHAKGGLRRLFLKQPSSLKALETVQAALP